LILTDGAEGYNAAGKVIGGFSNFVMGGDFVIGIVVFLILVIVNFLVITKGATRIAEVAARFTLDAIPGKQMAIDADLSAGLIDDKEAQRRRKELEEESSFFGAMDGASKFVRGDAIAGIIITAVNIFGGIIIGVTRHNLSLAEAVDVFTKLSVGDGLVSQIPALVISLAAGLLVSKGGTRGSTEKAVLGQLGNYPRALFVSGVLMLILSIAPGLPFLPFALLGAALMSIAYTIPRRRLQEIETRQTEEANAAARVEAEERDSVKESLNVPDIELILGPQINSVFLPSHDDLAQRVAKMRRKFAKLYGFVVPEIKLSTDVALPPKCYQIKIHGTVLAKYDLQIGDVLVVTGEQAKPNLPCEETREPAFGMKSYWVSEAFIGELEQQGFTPITTMSVLLTHLNEVIRNNLANLLSYKDMTSLVSRLDKEYKRLLDEIIPSHLSHSGLQAILKLLLAERVSIRNLHLVLEAVAEIAPHARKVEHIVEHVRIRLAQQICGDLSSNGVLKVLRLGNRWDMAFHESIKRDQNGQTTELNVEPSVIEEFSKEASEVIRGLMDEGQQFVIVTLPEARPFVRLVIERLFPNLAILSQLELGRSIQTESLGTIS
ncbi:MAG: flagellar type III secretion system protein FlhA, partial [Hyphomicrobiales bacterium]|nr:flagellar type III secretion system protein FlhA [Hyphomicrobiales bacterium]